MNKRKGEVKIIIFAGGSDPLRKRLHLVISMHLALYKIEVCPTIAALSRRLRRSLDPLIIVLLITRREDLDAIMGLRELLNDRRLILILPDDNPDELTMAHALRPRFITYRDRDFLDVSAVLGRMIALQDRDAPLLP